MESTTTLIFSWLNFLNKKRYDALLEKFGTLDAALQNLDEELLRQLRCQNETIYRVLNRLDEFDPESYQTELQKRELQLISIEDNAYPAALRQLPDPPIFLYCKGSLDILNQPCIGCVGRREMSDYGKRVTQHFVPEFIRAGMVTVSGLALGVDAEVARESLAASGRTVAVVGGGLASIYPKENKRLADEIVEAGGLVLCEFPLDQAPDKYTFPARNRIIAGLSLGTVVLEAGKGSGALITADLALEYNKDVFAVPGQIFDPGYAGCHEYIAQGRAKLVMHPEEVLQDIGIVRGKRKVESGKRYDSNDPEEQKIYDVLTTMPQSVSDIVEKAQIDAAIVSAKLTMLELQSVAKDTGSGMWVRT